MNRFQEYHVTSLLAFSARSQWLSDVNSFDQYCQQNTTDFYKFIEILFKYEARTRSLHGMIINVEQINQTELNHKPLLRTLEIQGFENTSQTKRID